MEYLGSLGRLVGLPCNSDQKVQSASRYVTETTVEGRRRAQARPASPRVWDVSLDLAEPDELHALSAFATGAWGGGPWHWVPVLAQHGNLLTPREALLLDRAEVGGSVMNAGPVRAADGSWAARSVEVSLEAGWTPLVRGVPVLPGRSLTWSVDVAGSGAAPQIQVSLYDHAGGYIGLFLAAGQSSGMQRVSLTVDVPDGAVEARVGVRSTVSRAARPQVTWTSGPVPWSAGHGCRSAIVDGVSEDLIVANRFGTYSQVGFQVLEVS